MWNKSLMWNLSCAFLVPNGAETSLSPETGNVEVPVVKNLPVYAGDMGSIPGLARSPGEGNGNPLRYFFLIYYFYLASPGLSRRTWDRLQPGSEPRPFVLGAWSLSHWTTRKVLTPVFLPREFHGQSSLVGYSPWGCKEWDMSEQLTFLLFSLSWCTLL